MLLLTAAVRGLEDGRELLSTHVRCRFFRASAALPACFFFFTRLARSDCQKLLGSGQHPLSRPTRGRGETHMRARNTLSACHNHYVHGVCCGSCIAIASVHGSQHSVRCETALGHGMAMQHAVVAVVLPMNGLCIRRTVDHVHGDQLNGVSLTLRSQSGVSVSMRV